MSDDPEEPAPPPTEERSPPAADPPPEARGQKTAEAPGPEATEAIPDSPQRVTHGRVSLFRLFVETTPVATFEELYQQFHINPDNERRLMAHDLMYLCKRVQDLLEDTGTDHPVRFRMRRLVSDPVLQTRFTLVTRQKMAIVSLNPWSEPFQIATGYPVLAKADPMGTEWTLVLRKLTYGG